MGVDPHEHTPSPSAPEGGPSSRGAIAAFLAVAAVVVAAAIAVAVAPTPAGATGLVPFADCPALAAYGAAGSAVPLGGSVGAAEDLASGAPTTVVPSPQATTSGAAPADADAKTGDTNTAVMGVDELDVIDRIDAHRELALGPEGLVVIDLRAGEVADRLAAPGWSQVTYDPEAKVAWVVGSSTDGMQVEVRRIRVGADGLAEAGTWRTGGQLVDARRTGDQLVLVATDGFGGPGGVPFAGGPVPCDQVLHPVGPADPTATLIVELPVEGDLAPRHSTEVVGSGQLVHVTDDAAYVATPQWKGSEPSTGIHRFSLPALEHTASGKVAGTMIGDLSMSDDGQGHLRVAITRQPMVVAVDDVVIADEGPLPAPGPSGGSAGSTGASSPSSDGSGSSADDEGPVTTVAAGSPDEPVSSPTVDDPTVTTIPAEEPPVATTVVEEPPVSEPPASIPPIEEPPIQPMPTVPPTVPVDQEPHNRIVVLDAAGDLHQIGATPWFGHPGETLQGVRFDGDVAYAVTYLQTDPFFVVDLADPTAPKVAGQVELPGFSSYLHPLGDGLVLGFGPDGQGQAEAKLFDASDPAHPKLVGTALLGGDSPVAYDRHALVDLGGGKVAVPVTPASAMAAGTVPCPYPSPAPDVDVVCSAEGPSTLRSEVVVLDTSGGTLRVVERHGADLRAPAQRVVHGADGWALLSGDQVAVMSEGGAVRATLDLS